MERKIIRREEIRPLSQSAIRYSPQSGFETGRLHLDGLMNNWWSICTRLATTPSAFPDELSHIQNVVREMFAGSHFQECGVKIDVMRQGPMIITIPEFNPHGQSFAPRIFAGHLDVVKGTPSTPEVDGDMIRSNGPAIDNKGPVAAIIATTSFIVENNIPHPRLRIILTGDEETDGQHIRQVPVGKEEMAFIADKSGSIGTIVTGSGGYTGIQAAVEGISGEKALEFLTNFDRRMGRNMIARRQNTPHSLLQLFADREFTVDTIIVGPNNSRNTVAETGSIQGRIACADKGDEQQILQNLTALLSPIGASIILTESENASLRFFDINLHGKAGHTSKAGTQEDNGFVNVFSDAAALLRNDMSDCQSGEIIPDDDVRINIGSLSGIRRGQEMDISLAGEARYMNETDARLVLHDLQQLVKTYGGSMEIKKENGAYQLDPQSPSVQEIKAVLEANGFPVTCVNRGFGIADANNGPVSWNTVVFSDGSLHPHTSEEVISIENVAGLLQVFYDLATQNYSVSEVNL